MQLHVVDPEVNLTESQLWHVRLGHPSPAISQRVISSLNLPFQKDEISSCMPCVKGKLHALPYTQRHAAQRVLEIVHSDVCGFISPISHDGGRYLLSFIDDFTHFAIVYIISHRSDFLNLFKQYYAYTKAKFSCQISVFRSDQGREYFSDAFFSFCSENGIFIDFSVRACPSQNGTAERFNRTIIEKARAMLCSTNLPATFWSEAVRCATYLYNRLPTSVLPQNLTPAMLWYGYEPCLHRLRVFGCLAYSLIPKAERQKFDSKAELCIMLGYYKTGYRLWSIKDKRIIISRNVIFNESFFPSLNINEVESLLFAASYTITAEYLSFNAEIYLENLPQSYSEILTRPDRVFWEKAMQREIQSIKENKTWVLVPLPSSEVSLVDSRWVFAKKPLEEGELKFKARLVARGFTQTKNVDYFEVYSPVATLNTIRTLLAYGNQFNFVFTQLDVKTAFLNGYLSETIYMKPPEGINVPPGMVFRLQKSLYGLKQAARCWNERFNNFVLGLGFRRSPNDICLYIKRVGIVFVYLILYVDDIILASSNESLWTNIKQILMREFSMKDQGILRNFLGLQIDYDRSKGILKIHQSSYIQKILKRFNFENANPSFTPMETKLKLSKSDFSLKPLHTKQPVRELIGCLMYLMLGTRPDIAFALNFFSRYQDTPSSTLWNYLTRILRYLKATQTYGIVYIRRLNENLNLQLFVDADWGSDPNDRKSTSGFCIYFAGNLVCWRSKKQPTIALSTAESELICLVSGLQDGFWFKRLLSQDFDLKLPFLVYEDNQAAIKLIQNPHNMKRVRHIDIKLYFLHEKLINKEFALNYITSDSQIADLFTKALAKDRFLKLRSYLVQDVTKF